MALGGGWRVMSKLVAAGLTGQAGRSIPGDRFPAWAREEPEVMWVALGMVWLLALGGPHQAWSFCPSQCSCSLHILSDGGKAR